MKTLTKNFELVFFFTYPAIILAVTIFTIIVMA